MTVLTRSGWEFKAISKKQIKVRFLMISAICDQGDYLLSPAYDLVCTALHIEDSSLALHNGLYDGDRAEGPYLNYGTYTHGSFILFAKKINILPAIAETIIEESLKVVYTAFNFVDRSFLTVEAKSKYKEIIGKRHRFLQMK